MMRNVNSGALTTKPAKDSLHFLATAISKEWLAGMMFRAYRTGGFISKRSFK